jgi:hypothetical protein
MVSDTPSVSPFGRRFTCPKGTSEWQDWVLGEDEAIKHIKAAWVAASTSVIDQFLTYVPDTMQGSIHLTPPM